MSNAIEDEKEQQQQQIEYSAEGVDYDTVVSSLAAQDRVPWYKKPNLRRLYLLFIGSVLCVETTSGYDASVTNGLQSVPLWNTYFHNPTGTILGLIGSMYALGAILSVPFVPYIADRFGRKFTTQLGCLVICIGASLQTASQNRGMFMASRAIIGIGITPAIVGASNLISELAHPKERARLGSLFNAFFFTGSSLAAIITIATFRMKSHWAWRIPSVFQILPAIVTLTFIQLIPESPRWLISKNRDSDALAILVKYHAEGDEHSEFARAEFSQIKQTLALEKELAKQSWGALIATRGNRRRALIAAFLGLATQWSGNGLISYYLSPILVNVGITDSLTKQAINLSITLWGAITAFTIAFFSTRFPRRKVYLTCTLSILTVFVIWTAASARYSATGSKSWSGLVIALIFIYQPCYNMAFNALSYAYLPELFPYQIRTRGASVFQWFSRAALFLNTFVNPIGMKNAGWKYLCSYCVFIAFEIVFIFFLFPETYGKTIEELAFLYEDDTHHEQARRVQNHKDDAERVLEEEHV
ncbi:uncharacterized protein L199_008706 [Kwoniella botswanensis]|uniref:uncharacterized protein n=1 Tax=Kwoniella botswanensis TaxID=1268659 RepID=UPI00315DFB06